MAATLPPETVTVKKQVLSDLALLAVAFVWGATFVLIKDIVEQLSPLIFLTARFALGSLSLALIMLFLGKWRGLTMREVVWGSLIGMALWVGYAFQTIGIQDTTASNAGFITGLAVVLVPVLGLFVLRYKPGAWAWTGVALAAMGLAMLSLRFDQAVVTGNFNEVLRLNPGDPIVLVCAFAFALQILFISRVAKWGDPLRVTMIQILVAGLLNGFGALLFETPTSNIGAEVWAGIAFMGIIATAAAITIQMTVQRYTTAVHTALIFTLEPVFAAMFGIALHGDRFGPIALSGGALILAGMIIAELGPHMGTLRTRRTRTLAANPKQLIPAVEARTDLPHSDVS
ncbi:MAG TPA: DMT family transporter [Chloroflexia bacterium]|nr:DMT family transporter [Chloroflexia bacterium]